MFLCSLLGIDEAAHPLLCLVDSPGMLLIYVIAVYWGLARLLRKRRSRVEDRDAPSDN